MNILNLLNNPGVNPLNDILDNPLDNALVLSDFWKSRASICKTDLKNHLKKVENGILKIIENDGDCSKDMKEFDKTNEMINLLKNILNRYRTEPLPPPAVKKISECEVFVYRKIMNSQVRNVLVKEAKEEERKMETLNDLIDEIDRMWDNDESEEDIKEKIYKVFKELHPNRLIDTIVDEFFAFATQDKNVRVNLSNEQINGLQREEYEKSNSQQDETEACGTCLENFSNGEECIVLHGMHRFHPNCIIPWLKMSVNCPTCRHDLRE